MSPVLKSHSSSAMLKNGLCDEDFKIRTDDMDKDVKTLHTVTNFITDYSMSTDSNALEGPDVQASPRGTLRPASGNGGAVSAGGGAPVLRGLPYIP